VFDNIVIIFVALESYSYGGLFYHFLLASTWLFLVG